MKADRKRNAILASVMMVVVAALLCITISLAWYTTLITDDVPVQLEANGMVVIDMDAGIELNPQDGKLTPAVENPDPAKNPIVNNTAMDVLNVSDTIVRKAVPVVYTTEIDVWLGKLNADNTPVAQNLHMGLTATLQAANGDKWRISSSELGRIVGYKLELDSFKIPNADDSATTWPPAKESIDYQPIKMVEDEPVYTLGDEPVLTLTENTRVFVRLTVWLSVPQGLLDPALQGGKLTLHLNVLASDNLTT